MDLSSSATTFAILAFVGLVLVSSSALGWEELPSVVAEHQRQFGDGSEGLNHFAFDIAVDGTSIAVSQSEADEPVEDGGAVHFYTESGGSWAKEQRLTLPEAEEDQRFGAPVEMEGSHLVASSESFQEGVPDNSGAVHVFERTSGSWEHAQNLTLSDRERDDYFGSTLALSGETLAASAPGNAVSEGPSGTVEVYTLRDGSWNEEQSLRKPSGSRGDRFGNALALEGDTLFVGAYGASVDGTEGAGRVFVFVRNGGGWEHDRTIDPPNVLEDGQFGRVVVVSGETLMIAAPNLSGDHPGRRGKVYVYRRDGDSWTHGRTLAPESASDSGSFGEHLALEGDTALVANNNRRIPLSSGGRHLGEVRVYRRRDSSWDCVERITASDPERTRNYIGDSVELSEEVVGVTAVQDNSFMAGTGTAHAFVLSPDRDGDGLPDSDDPEPDTPNEPDAGHGGHGGSGPAGCGCSSADRSPIDVTSAVLFLVCVLVARRSGRELYVRRRT